nr:putative inactive deoxyuridine 5'-triphosphate nucleotidohydrolase-like protein FLJ16323 [Macaca nemestrina]
MPLPGDTTIILLNWKLRMLLCLFGLLMSLNRQRRELLLLVEIIDPDYQGEVGLLVHNNGTKLRWRIVCRNFYEERLQGSTLLRFLPVLDPWQPPFYYLLLSFW